MGNEERMISGTSLKIYLHLLRSGKPLGVREIQRQLKIKSPGTVKYHLDKLMRLGLVDRVEGRYTAVKPNPTSIYSLYAVFMGTLIPRMLVYSIFLTTAFLVYLYLSPLIDYGLLTLLVISLVILWVESIRLYRIASRYQG